MEIMQPSHWNVRTALKRWSELKQETRVQFPRQEFGLEYLSWRSINVENEDFKHHCALMGKIGLQTLSHGSQGLNPTGSGLLYVFQSANNRC